MKNQILLLSSLFFLTIQMDSIAQLYPDNFRPYMDKKSEVLEQFRNPLLYNKGLAANQTTSLIPIYDSIYYWAWIDGFGWTPTVSRRETNFVYDAGNRLMNKISQNGNISGNWYNNSQVFYTYDSTNNLLSETFQQWNTSWDNWRQWIYTYNSNNQVTNMLAQQFSGMTNQWINEQQFVYTYDVNQNLSNLLIQNWQNSSWNNFNQTNHSYDANNNLINSVDQDWNGITWDNLHHRSYTYDVNNNLINLFSEHWNGSVWVNDIQYNYTYDINNNLTNQIAQIWNGALWTNSYNVDYLYDVNNNLIYYLMQGLYHIEEKYFYDINNILQIRWQRTYNFGSSMDAGDSVQYYYHTATGIENNSLQNNISISPNPFHSQLTITFQSQNIKQTTFILRNTLGQTVYHTEENNLTNLTKTIDISYLSKGIYLLDVMMDGERVVRKIVKE